jgi:hypothetical protein
VILSIPGWNRGWNLNELLNFLSKHNVIHSYIIDPESQLVAVRLYEDGPLHQFNLETVAIPSEPETEDYSLFCK